MSRFSTKPAFSVAARERPGLSKQHKQPIQALGEQTTKVPFPTETKPKQLMAKQPGTQLNSNAISPRLQINFPTRLSGVNASLGGRLRFFHKNWSMITSDPYILEIVQGYKLDLVEIPFQAFTPKPLLFSKTETELLDNEIRDLHAKNAIRVVQPTHGQFISTVFAVPKKTAEQGL